jgi:hypothetical protein
MATTVQTEVPEVVELTILEQRLDPVPRARVLMEALPGRQVTPTEVLVVVVVLVVLVVLEVRRPVVLVELENLPL